jgi:hypothetical protein
MRLSEWRASPPTRDSMTLKVVAVIEPVLAAIGAERDPPCWVVWGDDPSVRYSILVPIAPGLVTCTVRVNVPGEGTRVIARLVRWSRVQLGEVTVETQAGHRVATFQVDQFVLRGADAGAGRVGEFAGALFAAVDGRPMTALNGRRRTKTATSARSRSGAKAAASKRARKPAKQDSGETAPSAASS